MRCQTVSPGPCRDCGNLFDRVNTSAGTVVRVFQRDEPSTHVVAVVRTHFAEHIFQSEQPAVSRDRPRGNARQPRDAASFPDVNVRGFATKHLIPRRGMDADRDLVGHRPGRYEERGFLAEHVRHTSLEREHSRIVAENVVTDLRRGHCRAHRGRGPGDGIGA